MKEDLIEKEIKRFGLMLQKLSGLVLEDDLNRARAVIDENFDEQVIHSFLDGAYDIAESPFHYKKLLFQMDLLYYKLLIQQKTDEVDRIPQQKYLLAAKRLVISHTGNFDLSLQMKMNQVEKF